MDEPLKSVAAWVASVSALAGLVFPILPLTCVASVPVPEFSPVVAKTRLHTDPVVQDAPKSESLQDRLRYPAHWWAPISRVGAPAWEILPQEAGPGEVIVSKRHELGLLSNFAATPFELRGVRYASLEGFWQMMLYPEGPDDPRARFPGLRWSFTREQVAQLTGFEAKDAGTLAEQNMARIGINWVSFEGERFEYRPERPGRHYALIVAAMREKVRQNPEVRRVLLATGDLVLRPDHHEEANAREAWRYCTILMQIRAELRGTSQVSQPDRRALRCADVACRPTPEAISKSSNSRGRSSWSEPSERPGSARSAP